MPNKNSTSSKTILQKPLECPDWHQCLCLPGVVATGLTRWFMSEALGRVSVPTSGVNLRNGWKLKVNQAGSMWFSRRKKKKKSGYQMLGWAFRVGNTLYFYTLAGRTEWNLHVWTSLRFCPMHFLLWLVLLIVFSFVCLFFCCNKTVVINIVLFRVLWVILGNYWTWVVVWTLNLQPADLKWR